MSTLDSAALPMRCCSLCCSTASICLPILSMIMYANKTNGSYVCPPSGTRFVEGKHPSQGGNCYPVELHQIVISMWENGEDLRAPRLMQLHHQRKFPSLSMCEHWIHQYQAEGKLSGFLFPISKGRWSRPSRQTSSRHTRLTSLPGWGYKY
jgi:hypothetical protein